MQTLINVNGNPVMITTAILSNGLKVANFSSPHDFTFEDSTILPAVSDDKAKELKVDFHETEFESLYETTAIVLNFTLSDRVLQELQVYEYFPGIVICPLPMITALKDIFGIQWVLDHNFRAVRIPDRITKKVSIWKFCI